MMTGLVKLALATAPIAMGLVFAAPAAAQAIGDKYWLRAGGYLADVDSSVRVTGDGGLIGTEVDFERDLDLEESRFLPSFTAGLGLGGGWSLNADFYTLGREGTVSLDTEVIVDDVIYPVGGSLTSGFRSTTGRLALGYSFLREDTYEIGAALGVHVTDFSIFFGRRGACG